MLNFVSFVLLMKPSAIQTIYEESGESDQGESENSIPDRHDFLRRRPEIGRARNHQRFSGDQQSLESISFNSQTPRNSRASRHRQQSQADTSYHNYQHDHSQHENDHHGENKCRCTTM
uniref:Uncharacterized protein n=1 Tax=Meloidogyne floridensis TaxID=298350 RepID=A0A915NW13_9BILA